MVSTIKTGGHSGFLQNREAGKSPVHEEVGLVIASGLGSKGVNLDGAMSYAQWKQPMGCLGDVALEGKGSHHNAVPTSFITIQPFHLNSFSYNRLLV